MFSGRLFLIWVGLVVGAQLRVRPRGGRRGARGGAGGGAEAAPARMGAGPAEADGADPPRHRETARRDPQARRRATAQDVDSVRQSACCCVGPTTPAILGNVLVAVVRRQ